VEIPFRSIDALREQISEQYGEWGPQVKVTQSMIDRFAEMTSDHQWIHVDMERARRGPFRTTIAHGFLLVALLPRCWPPQAFEVTGHGSIVNYGCESYRFLAPVPAEASVQAKGRLVDVRERPQGTLLVRELSLSLVGSVKPSLVYRAMSLYQA
jgi:acyl dehydratase